MSSADKLMQMKQSFNAARVEFRALEAERDALAAENARLRSAVTFLLPYSRHATSGEVVALYAKTNRKREPECYASPAYDEAIAWWKAQLSAAHALVESPR